MWPQNSTYSTFPLKETSSLRKSPFFHLNGHLFFKQVFLPQSFLSHVSEQGGLGWEGVGDSRKVPLLESLVGEGVGLM